MDSRFAPRETRWVTTLLAAFATSILQVSGQAADKVTFDDHILPIFESACLNCHNPDKKRGDLDLSNFAGVMAGGSGGEVAAAGDGAGALLYATIIHAAEPFMPPRGEKLAKKDADLVKAWIDGGLLENKSSKAKKPSGPRIAKLDVDPSAKPEGPPPMPGNLNLEPAVTSSRNTTVQDMDCSPWAPLLAVTAQKQILLYNTDTLRLAAILPFPAGFPETVSFHPTGKYLVAGGGIAGKSGTTHTWDITTGRMLMTNGREFDSVLAASLRLDLGGVAFGGPSRLIKLWDTQNGEEIKAIKKHTDWVTSLSYSPDGVLLATGDRNGGVWVWEAHTGNEFHNLRGHGGGINAIAWRADSNLVGTASEDGQVIFWEMNNGGQVKRFTAHSGGTLSLDYARNGEFVTSGRNREVKIWKSDFNLKKALPTFNEMVVETAITHDGKRIFTADWNGVIEAWDATTFQKIGTLSGNPPRIADRIQGLEKALSSAPENTASTLAALEAARTKISQLQASLAKTEAAVRAGEKEKDRITAEKGTLEATLAQTNSSIDSLGKNVREDMSQALTLAQDRSDAHQQAIARVEAEIKTFQIAPLEVVREKLAAEAHRLREQAEHQPGDTVLKNQADEAARKLANHEAKLTEIRSRLQSAEDKLKDLTSQSDAIASNVSEAGKALNAANRQLQALDTSRKEITAQVLAADAALKENNTKLATHRAALKPAQENLATSQKALAEPKASYEKASAHEAKIRGDLKFWRAAEVNAKALVITEKRDTLKSAQDEESAAADSISRQLEEFRTELSKIESRKGVLTGQLDKLSKEVMSLRESLARRQPLLDQAERESEALQMQYKKLSE